MAFRITLQITTTDAAIDGEIEAIAKQMGGRSAGWTKGRVVCEGVRMLARNLPRTQPVYANEPQEEESEIM